MVRGMVDSEQILHAVRRYVRCGSSFLIRHSPFVDPIRHSRTPFAIRGPHSLIRGHHSLIRHSRTPFVYSWTPFPIRLFVDAIPHSLIRGPHSPINHMPPLRLPRAYHLRRAVECFEHVGDLRGAADSFAMFGTPATSAEAARRYVALGDLPAAGEAYVAAGELRAALACFAQAQLPERVLACLQQLHDDAATGVLLLELGRSSEAVPALERALAAATDPAPQATLHLQLAQALGVAAGAAHYRAGLALLERLPPTGASAEAWVALGAWGVATERQDRTQEGYAQALALLVDRDPARWRTVAERYRVAAHVMGNRRLAQTLAAELERRTATEAAPPPADPAQALLDAERWDDALTELDPRARHGDATATWLLATMIEGPTRSTGSASVPLASSPGAPIIPPLPIRMRAAEILGPVGDPRLLDAQRGDAPLGGYWCALDAGPFWYGAYMEGDDQERANATVRQVTLPYSYRIARYTVTNAEYRRFIAAGGYQAQQWWTAQGWTYRERQSWTTPRLWDNTSYNQPTQPVVGVSWYEAVAYCAWLTEVGRNAGWLPSSGEIRLPTSLEWERAARGTDQRRYPWGDETPDTERANYQATGIGRPTAVGCFPAGGAACGALDMAGNVMEWMSTPVNARDQLAPQKDFTPSERVLASWSAYHNQSEQMSCGARSGRNPYVWYNNWGFRVVWSLAL